MRFNDMSGTNEVKPDMAPWVGSTPYQYRDWSVPLPTAHYLPHRDRPWSTTRLIGSTLLEPPNNRGHHHEVKLLLSLKYALACTLGELTREIKRKRDPNIQDRIETLLDPFPFCLEEGELSSPFGWVGIQRSCHFSFCFLTSSFWSVRGYILLLSSGI